MKIYSIRESKEKFLNELDLALRWVLYLFILFFRTPIIIQYLTLNVLKDWLAKTKTFGIMIQHNNELYIF